MSYLTAQHLEKSDIDFLHADGEQITFVDKSGFKFQYIGAMTQIAKDWYFTFGTPERFNDYLRLLNAN